MERPKLHRSLQNDNDTDFGLNGEKVKKMLLKYWKGILRNPLLKKAKVILIAYTMHVVITLITCLDNNKQLRVSFSLRPKAKRA